MSITRNYLVAATLAAALGTGLGGVAVPTVLAQQAEQAPTATASGEVRRVDAAKGRITIKHDAISALELPAMSLVYHIDPALLANIKPGQKVTFTATRRDKQYVVTKIE